MTRLVVVSNRVTVPSARDRGAAGGLAVAIHAALKRHNGLWFGWSGEVSETESLELKTHKAGSATIATIDLTREDVEEYYEGFANRTLWPLFHYRTDLTSFDRQFSRGYERVNARFAHAIKPLLKPDDLIWVHDYHLLTFGAELRRMDCRQRIGFFLHIPFPAPEVLLTLPQVKSLVQAMFAYDLIGFQTASDYRSFREYVLHVAHGREEQDGRLTCFGRTVTVAPFPIGIDTPDFVEMSHSPEAKRTYDRMRLSLGERRMVIGVDRLDYTKGLPERFDSIERLLRTYPENRGTVVMLQIAPPTRAGVPEYEEIREELEARAGHINGAFADVDWVPIRYVNRGHSRRALAGLYRASRIGLVTPLRDGMNLVAKEFVAAQDPADPGVLVLSRFAGASRQLREALIVNPHDLDDVVEAMQTGLNMPLAERKRRWRALMDVVEREDVYRWRDDFVAALQATEAANAAAA